MAKSSINWQNILTRINSLLKRLKEQNFRYDVAGILMDKLYQGLKRRIDIHYGVISAYWANFIYDYYVLNNFNLEPTAVLFETNYYSYLDLSDLNDANKQTGMTTYVVDFIADSTDLKTGEDLDVWLGSNDDFKDYMKRIWMARVAPMYIQQGILVTKKVNVRLEDYWRYEAIIYALRVWDEDLNIMVVFLLGTYDNYPITYSLAPNINPPGLNP